MSQPLSPRAVALHGLGFVQRLVALQGLWPASPYRRAPRGPGYPARPVYGIRPRLGMTSRPTSPNTVRHRR